jgi:membrane-bound ClpP family serine protease
VSTLSTDPSVPPPPAPPEIARPRNGLGVAALVLGVASLVAAISFVLFPLGLIGGLVGLILGIVALVRKEPKKSTNSGQAIAGIVCSAIALVLAVNITVHVGTWIARNTSTFTKFDTCITQAGDRIAVSNCIATFAREVRS